MVCGHCCTLSASVKFCCLAAQESPPLPQGGRRTACGAAGTCGRPRDFAPAAAASGTLRPPPLPNLCIALVNLQMLRFCTSSNALVRLMQIRGRCNDADVMMIQVVPADAPVLMLRSRILTPASSPVMPRESKRPARSMSASSYSMLPSPGAAERRLFRCDHVGKFHQSFAWTGHA